MSVIVKMCKIYILSILNNCGVRGQAS